LLYAGLGLGLLLWRLVTRASTVHMPKGEARWLALAILSGGVIAPVLLMQGLAQMPASGASLLLNAEAVLTAVIAWGGVPRKRRPAHRARHGGDRGGGGRAGGRRCFRFRRDRASRAGAGRLPVLGGVNLLLAWQTGAAGR
jgi:EamA-like transporter family